MFIVGFLVIWATFAFCNIFYLRRLWPHPQNAFSISKILNILSNRGEKYILTERNLEPDFGNLPYPEKVPGTTRPDLGKIDKNHDIFTFCETVHRNQNLEPLPEMVLGEPKMTTLSQFFTQKVPVKLAE